MTRIGIFALVLGVLALLWLAIGFYTFAAFCMRRRGYDPSRPEHIRKTMPKAYADAILEGQAWIEAQSPERVEIQSFDGLRLVGHYIPHENARGTGIFFHGYRSRWNIDFASSMPFYYGLGFSLLAVDVRAHGDSEGGYMTYGIRERKDVLAWVNYINGRVGTDTPILIGGLSMGSATVQMACGLPLPKNVRAVVSDCGFTSPYEIGCRVLKQQHMPAWLVLPQMNLFCRLLAGFGLKEYSTLTAQAQNTIPTFFVHGDADQLVPLEMSQRNYEACKAEKHLLIIPGAPHAVSYLFDRPLYERELEAFLAKYF